VAPVDEDEDEKDEKDDDEKDDDEKDDDEKDDDEKDDEDEDENENGEFFNKKLTPYNGESVFCDDDEKAIYRVMNSVLRQYGSMRSVRSWEEDPNIDTDDTDDFTRIDCTGMNVKIGPNMAGTRIEEEGRQYYAAERHEGKIVECEDGDDDARYRMEKGKLRHYTSTDAYDYDKKKQKRPEIKLECNLIPMGDDIYFEELQK
tara:strand:- start:14 stop:619 length:606 start_codon:yes stop_codon:yes gene_type:complete